MTKTRITTNIPDGIKAYYDPGTDTVYTNSLYTYSWYHEMAHADQQKNIFLRYLVQVYPSIAYHVAFFFLLGSIFFLKDFFLSLTIMGIFYLPIVLTFGFCEVHAYIVGWINYKRKKHYEVDLI